MPAGNLRVLCRHAHMARSPDVGLPERVRRRRDGEAAMPDIEIERRIDLRIVEFHQHIVAGDAELCRAEGDKSGGIEAADADQVETGLAGSKAELPRRGVLECGLRLDADFAQQRHHLAEDTPVRQCHDQRIAADGPGLGGHKTSSKSWRGCHGVGQGSPRSLAWQRIRATSIRIAAPPENSRWTARSSGRIASKDSIRPSSLRRNPLYDTAATSLNMIPHKTRS